MNILETKIAKNLLKGDEIFKLGDVDHISKQNHLIVVKFTDGRRTTFNEHESVTTRGFYGK